MLVCMCVSEFLTSITFEIHLTKQDSTIPCPSVEFNISCYSSWAKEEIGHLVLESMCNLFKEKKRACMLKNFHIQEFEENLYLGKERAIWNGLTLGAFFNAFSFIWYETNAMLITCFIIGLKSSSVSSKFYFQCS